MNILTDYVLIGEDTKTFDKYIKDTCPKNTVKLKEQLLIYIVSPNQANLEQLTYAYAVTNSPIKNIDFSIIFIPGETPEIIKHMMKFELLKNYDIYSFKIELTPIDQDLLSLELEDSFKEIFIDKNNSSIQELADTMLKLEVAFGKINNKYIKGDYGKIFNDLLTLKEEEHNIKNQDQILGMIVIDRSSDFITPLLSNYTYEALIDEIYGIKDGGIKVKKSMVKNYFGKNVKKLKKTDDIIYPLTSNINKFYSNLRCMHYVTALGQISAIEAHFKKNLNSEFDEKSTKNMSGVIANWKDYVFAKPDLDDHTSFLTSIINKNNEVDVKTRKLREQSLLKGMTQINSEEFFDDYISEKKDLEIILNLMALESMTQNGISNYNSIKRDILTIYGYQNIFLFRNLESLGWLKEKEKALMKIFKTKYQTICEKLNLNNLDFKLNEPFSLEYVEHGYCPISLKLIEKAGEGNWGDIRDALQEIPGATIFPDNEEEMRSPNEKLNTIFVVFVGGVTYTEIQGIRYLNRKYKQSFDNSTDPNKTRKQLIIVTTGIINPKKIYDSLGMNFKCTYTIKQFNDDINQPETPGENAKKKK